MRGFFVVTGTAVDSILAASSRETLNLIKHTYIAHHEKRTINPDSYFLRFDDNPTARIIALPAALKGSTPISGIKWIASYPDNVRQNLQRASAVLILNDYVTGYPLACIEASNISTARTAASAVIAARALAGKSANGGRLAVIGAGVIARTILQYFYADDWQFSEARVCDLDPQSGHHLAGYFQQHFEGKVSVVSGYREAIEESDVVVLATTASTPYIADLDLFRPGQIVLNISLRDLSEDIILNATNIFDDIEHCLKANTSPHLAEIKSGGRAFAHATIAEVLNGSYRPDETRPVVFSPFGLGVLDLALGQAVYNTSISEGLATALPDFYSSRARW